MRLLEEKLEKFGSIPGLERIKLLMEKLGNPQNEYKVVLVGGTNGKGSTVTYLSSILGKSGLKTGSFYSPHMKNYQERFQVNNKMIGKKELEKYEKLILDLIDQGMEITMFEALTAIAYKYFADKQVDIAVMEVGMGGEFDATNIARPDLAIITNVELEHTQHLGKSIEEIAKTKAGILKHAKTGITGCSQEALSHIESVKPVKSLGRDFFIEPREVNNQHSIFSYLGKQHYSDLELSLLGRHQIDNAALAVAAAEELISSIDEQAIREGLLNADHSARLQVLSKKPLVLLDAAHNPAGIGTLITSLSLFDYDKLIVVFGSRETKNWREMIRLLGMHADTIIANKAKGKSVDPKEITKVASLYTETKVSSDVKGSLKKAKSIAKEKDMILVCGSIYMLGELLG
jgi:dihydrofolate synthase/folylpolyglutamate synthase